MIENEDLNNENTGDSNEESFDLMGLLLECLSKWKWFVLSVVVCLGLAWYVLAGKSPVYRVDAAIYLNSESSSVSSTFFQDQASIFDFKPEIDEAELMILKSRNNLLKVVDSLDLAYSYYTVRRFRDDIEYGENPIVAHLDSVSLHSLKSPITILCSRSDDGVYEFDIKSTLMKKEDGVVKPIKEDKTVTATRLPVKIELSQGTLTLSPSPIGAQFTGKHKIVIANPYDVATGIAANMTVEFPQKSTTIVNISYSTLSPEQGEAVINTMIKVYNNSIAVEKNRSAMQTEAFIINRLALVESELTDAERDVESYRREHNIADIPAETSDALQRSSYADRELAEVEVRQRIANDVERIVASADNFSPLPQVIDDPNLNAVITNYNKKLAQRASLLEGGTESNPLIKNIDVELAHLKNEIYRGILNIRNSIEVQRNNIARQEGSANSRLSTVPSNERELFSRIRKQTVKENIYNYLLEKREEIAIQKTLTTPMARLVDDPNDEGVVSPNYKMFYLLALLLGLLIPALIIYLRRLFFPIIKEKSDVERITKIPVMGEIAEAPKDKNFVVARDDTSALAELFRLLRNNVQFVLGKNKKVILVTSTLSGEGKTFVAANLSLAFALSGKKTVVVGLDIRRPFLAKRFHRSNEKGVTSFLAGQTDDAASLISQSDQNENLYILTAGPTPPNPNELLMSDRMDLLLDQLRRDFDIVIIDSAPIGVVSDSLLVSNKTDLQIYVTRAGFSTKKCIETLHDAVRTKRLLNPFIIVNGVNIHANAYLYKRYGKYGHYGKYSGYGYTHSHERKHRNFFQRLFDRK